MVGMEAVGRCSPGHRGQVGDPHGGGWALWEEGSAGILTGKPALQVPLFSPTSLRMESGTEPPTSSVQNPQLVSGTDRGAVVKKGLSVPTDGEQSVLRTSVQLLKARPPPGENWQSMNLS